MRGPGFDTRSFVSPSAFSRRVVVSYWRKYVHEVLVNRLGGLSLPRKSVVRLTDRPDMTLDVYNNSATTTTTTNHILIIFICKIGLHSVVDILMGSEPMYPGFESRRSHVFFFFFFFFFLICFILFIYFFYVFLCFYFFIFFLSLLLQCKFANSTLLSLLSFSYFITPYDAQASSAFSALI